MSLDEPESTDRNTPLGKQPWHTNTGFSTLVPAVDSVELNVVDSDDVTNVDSILDAYAIDVVDFVLDEVIDAYVDGC